MPAKLDNAASYGLVSPCKLLTGQLAVVVGGAHDGVVVQRVKEDLIVIGCADVFTNECVKNTDSKLSLRLLLDGELIRVVDN